MFLKQFPILTFLLFLVCLCTAITLSEEQVSLSTISQKSPKAIRKTYVISITSLEFFVSHLHNTSPTLLKLVFVKWTHQCRLKKAHIIPDILDDFLSSCYLHIIYASSHEEIWLGDKIKPSHTKKAPVVRISCPDSKPSKDNKGFTVALTDPDAPSRKNPEWSEMCHWIVTVSSSAITWQEDEDTSDEKYEGSKEIIECESPFSFPFCSLSPPQKNKDLSTCIAQSSPYT
jgi:hypothetical protein